MGKIGFIGFGAMGGIMVKALAEAKAMPGVFDEVLSVTLAKREESRKLMREQYGVE